MDLTTLFGKLPAGLRTELLDTYATISRHYVERRWEPSELNGGKLCEIIYTIVLGELTGNMPASASKPNRFPQACQALEQQPATHPAERSLRIGIPRTLVMLYEIRNNRGVGHVGGEVDPNEMDAHLVYTTASWLVAELVRIYHGVSTGEAQAAVSAITERKLPFIWQVEDIRRVLAPEMNVTDEILLLLYSVSNWVPVADLVKWTEYSNPSRLRTKVLAALHKARVVEFDVKNGRALLTSFGVARVERDLLPGVMKRNAA